MYMVELKKVLDSKGHGLLEMPSGTGKTVTLLSFVLAYQHRHPDRTKLVYCSRTVPEIEKTLEELKFVMQYRQKYSTASRFLGIGLTSRRNLCLNTSVNSEKIGRVVDAKCYERIASFQRQQAAIDATVELCDYFETLEKMGSDIDLPGGIYNLDDLREYGTKYGVCPYFLARKLIGTANVVVYSYYYLLDPKINELVNKELRSNTVVVFDEAHNIDNVCLEVLSVSLTRKDLDLANRGLAQLNSRLEIIRQTDPERLVEEYNRLLGRLREPTHGEALAPPFSNFGTPVIPRDGFYEAIPGNIRKSEHFVAFLTRMIEYLKFKLKGQTLTTESPLVFLKHLWDTCFIDKKTLQGSFDRLVLLFKTFETVEMDEMYFLQKICHFSTLVGTYSKGFSLLFEPFGTEKSKEGVNAVLHLCCLDASLIMSSLFSRFDNIVITSGTLSPLGMYPKILDFCPKVSCSLPMTMSRDSFCPLIVGNGSDQVALTSKFEFRDDITLTRNYGMLVLEFSKITPDGMVVFFPSYIYMKNMINAWHELGLVNKILETKLLFIETQDSFETSVALTNYRQCCDNGRGGMLFSVARGKVSEGIDFTDHYGRTVILVGIPYQYTESQILRLRLEYLRDIYAVKENDFLTFDALRHASQCLGRVLRSKTDYGVMVLADKRFSRADKRFKLPRWIQSLLGNSNINLTTDMAVSTAKSFFKHIAQPNPFADQLGVSLWDESHLCEYQKKGGHQ